VKFRQWHYQKVHIQPQTLFSTKIQSVALPEIPCPAMEFISQRNPASSSTRNSTSSDEMYCPLKSSQSHYWTIHVQLWDFFPTEIQPVELPEIPCPAIGFLSQ